uniref:Uncharacterized protein n=1 Tax=Knipowitschia caucasica TaxID=637954 RepID=A0AAV2LC30_KNICA
MSNTQLEKPPTAGKVIKENNAFILLLSAGPDLRHDSVYTAGTWDKISGEHAVKHSDSFRERPIHSNQGKQLRRRKFSTLLKN